MDEKPIKTFDFTNTHEHPEGRNRGGYAQETHTFSVFADGRVVHSYSLDCNGSDPDSYGLDKYSLGHPLYAKEDALNFVDSELNAVKNRLHELEELRKKIEESKSYEDKGDGTDEEDEEEHHMKIPFEEVANGYGFEEIEQTQDGIYCTGCYKMHKRPTKVYGNGTETLCKFQVMEIYGKEYE